MSGTSLKLSNAEQRRVDAMTNMLLSVSVVFVLLTLPTSIYLLFPVTWLYEFDSPHQEAQVNLGWAVCNMLVCVNHSINFLLYCISSTLFRRQVKNIFSFLTK